jgi:hypothetical protein
VRSTKETTGRKRPSKRSQLPRHNCSERKFDALAEEMGTRRTAAHSSSIRNVISSGVTIRLSNQSSVGGVCT